MTDIEDAVRAWAQGVYPIEAGVELLIRTGRVYDGAPWVKTSGGSHAWIDVATLVSQSGTLSGGERRLVDIAASLLSPDHRVDLNDAMTGIDRPSVSLVLAALAHASGSHEYSGFEFDDDGQPTSIRQETTLYAWPS